MLNGDYSLHIVEITLAIIHLVFNYSSHAFGPVSCVL